MSSMQKLFLIVIIGIIGLMLIEPIQSTCFEDWSRCTSSTSGMTGYLWQSCQDRCICMGKAGGNCRDTPNTCDWLPEGSTIQQCQCYGTGQPLSTWQTIACETPWGGK